MRTAGNAIKELCAYLEGNGFIAYPGERKPIVERDFDTQLFDPYLVIISTPTSLLRGDMRAAGNENDPRLMYITISAVGNLRDDGVDDAADLLEQVNSLLEFKWAPSDGDALQPAASYDYDTVNVSTQVPRVVHVQRYKLYKNTRNF